MVENNIKPEKITKPIQLLAVWLIGLILIESSLLTASGTITNPQWLSVFFGISAVCIIPLFLGLIFLLQTKFRPQIQEDEYYSKYLDKNTMRFVDIPLKTNISKDFLRDEIESIVKETQENFENIKSKLDEGKNKEEVTNLITVSDSKIAELEKIVKFSGLNIHINKLLPTFNQIVNVIRKIGFNYYEEFGEEAIPPNFLVSFSKRISPIIIRDLLFEVIPLGATYANLIDDHTFEKYGDAIFIGSYLYKKSDKIIIDQKFLKNLATITKESTIFDLLNMNIR